MSTVDLKNITQISLQGSLSDGGWTCTLNALNSGIDFPSDREVTIDIKDYLTTWDASWGRLFKGFVLDPVTQAEWEAGKNSLTLTTSHAHLKEGWLRTTGFIETAISPNMHRVAPGALTSEYIIRHLLTYHCNLGRVIAMDIDTGGYDYQDVTFQDGKFWESLDYLARAEMKMMYFDRQNVLHYKSHPAFITPVPDAVMIFTTDYMASAPSFTNHAQRVAQAQCFGFTDQLVEIASF